MAMTANASYAHLLGSVPLDSHRRAVELLDRGIDHTAHKYGDLTQTTKEGGHGRHLLQLV